jgi:uncharacterized protein (TIGR02271 family)
MTSPTNRATRGSTVVGLFPDRDRAEQAIHSLEAAGFSKDQIGVAMRDRHDQQALTGDTGASPAEGATKGAVTGGIAGGLIGLLAALIPGIGPIIVAGWLGSTLVGAGIGAVAGGLIGGLVDLGLSETEAKHFEHGVREGRVLVTVNAGDRAADAYAVLQSEGADLGPDASSAAGTAETTPAAAATMQAQRLQLRDEELEVRKQPVQAGEVRIRKEVVTEQRTIDVPVTREEVVIERHQVADGTPAVAGAGADQDEVRIPVMEEQVKVEKRPVVREEISVGKREVEDVRHVEGTVSHEEARIENAGNARIVEGAPSGGRTKERRRNAAAGYEGTERRQAQL